MFINYSLTTYGGSYIGRILGYRLYIMLQTCRRVSSWKIGTFKLPERFCQSRYTFKASAINYVGAANPDVLFVSEEIRESLHARAPVVALETTIITHGMRYPYNLSTALEAEKLIRENGVVPATIGIINGRIYVGLTQLQLEYLADHSTKAVKTSRRDIPFVISQKVNGGTTVSGTMVIAHLAGIPIFVTGGVGGVHRGAESSMDVSADLTELGRTPVAIISAGIKSILDIGRTLEYLETQGVCVASYGLSREFPAFFTRKSGHLAPFNMQTPLDAASLIYSNHLLGLQNGMLIAVPIPEQFDTLGKDLEMVIQSVVQESQDKNIHGKEVTPYILQRLNECTSGMSLEANIHLLKNNADIGSRIAVELSRLCKESTAENKHNRKRPYAIMHHSNFEKNDLSIQTKSKRLTKASKKVTVIGGSIADFTVRLATPDYKTDGATYPGNIRLSFGGVGRNIADGLTRLGVDTLFISAIGNDEYRSIFEECCQHMSLTGVVRLDNKRTATCAPILQSNGELIFGIGDMDIHDAITPEYISSFEMDLLSSALVCVDGNISSKSIEYVCDLCAKHGIPVFFEPTDITKAAKPFTTSVQKALMYASPNLNELKTMVSHLTNQQIHTIAGADDRALETILDECTSLLQKISSYIPVTLATLGKHGVVLCYHGNKSAKFPLKGDVLQLRDSVTMEHFFTQHVVSNPPAIISVSGAGDCMVAAFIASILDGHDPTTCIHTGLCAAHISLQSNQAVPVNLDPYALSQQLSSIKIMSRKLM